MARGFLESFSRRPLGDVRSLGRRRIGLGQRASVPARHISGSPAMSPRRPGSNLARTSLGRNPSEPGLGDVSFSGSSCAKGPSRVAPPA